MQVVEQDWLLIYVTYVGWTLFVVIGRYIVIINYLPILGFRNKTWKRNPYGKPRASVRLSVTVLHVFMYVGPIFLLKYREENSENIEDVVHVLLVTPKTIRVYLTIIRFQEI